MESNQRSSFGALLRKLRLSRDLSQEALAERARISIEAIGALERGDRTSPQRQTLSLLIDALELGSDDRLQLEAAAMKPFRHRRTFEEPTSHEEVERRSNLPLQLTAFVGRESATAEIKTLLKHHRLVSLVGTGGVGKTRCAIQAGMEMLDAWSDGVWFVDVAPLAEPSNVPNAVAQVLNVMEVPQRPLIEALRASLRRKRLLLILDNCEHVLDGARTLVSAILPACPDVRVLATSRQSLTIAGEEVYHVPPLSVPPRGTAHANDAIRYGAVQLFLNHSVAVDKRFALTDENATAVTEICRRLDGIPLAIQLAAARVKVLSPRELVQKLDERLHLLTSGDHTAAPHHRTMRALVDWSYDLLSDNERTVFVRLSAFSGSFSLDLAYGLCRDYLPDHLDLLEAVSSLVDKSLLQSETVDDETRYRLLESIRQYAEEKLEEPERSKIIYTHAHLFAELAEQMDQESASTPDQIWSQRAKLELENWRSVLRWSLQERNDLLLGQRLTAAMRSIWCRLGPVEGQRWVRAALDSSDAHTPVQIVALLFLTQAHLAMLLTEYHTGAAAAKNALELLKQINDVEHGSEAQLFAGAALALLGDTASGESMLNAALGNFRVRGKNRQVAAALQYLGLMHVSMGNVRQARSFFTEALAIFKATSGAERSAAHIALALAETEFRAGDPARALQLAAEALSLDRARNDESLVVFDLCNVSAYLIALDRLDEASATALEALSLARETHVDAGIIVALQHVAACAALPGANGSYENTGVAARLIGFVDCRIAQLDYRRDYTEQQEYERIVRCFTHFSTPEYESLKREGAAWSETYACEVASQIASLQT